MYYVNTKLVVTRLLSIAFNHM